MQSLSPAEYDAALQALESNWEFAEICMFLENYRTPLLETYAHLPETYNDRSRRSEGIKFFDASEIAKILISACPSHLDQSREANLLTDDLGRCVHSKITISTE